jgi:small subunit ribosomal protein S13
MIRIASRNINDKKRARFALSPIRGIGKSNVKVVLKKTYDQAVAEKKIKMTWEEFVDAPLADYPEEVVVILRKIVENDPEFLIEADLRREVNGNIKRLIDMDTWRGRRHKARLPVRGQKTKTNSRTVRGNVRSSGASGKVKPQKT